MSDESISEILLNFRNTCYTAFGSKVEDLVGRDIYPRLLGRMLSLSALSGEGKKYDQFLDEIPTETTIGERKFLFNFFAHLWGGHYHVLEIGPFLGGSTRAMAAGMHLNPNRLERCRLYTYDKFTDYYNPQRLLEFLSPLFEKGVLQDEVRSQIEQSADFQSIFSLIHKGHDYYRLIKHEQGVLPNLAEQQDTLPNIFKLPAGLMFDVVFVDGCKSWYGTKYFMCELCDHMVPGSYFVFQDYGAFTCFWIPVFVAMLADHFKLLAYVDNTYAFRLNKPLDAEEIHRRFPDSPEQMGRSNLNLIFTELLKTAMVWNDTFTLVNFHLQHAAALAYIGDRDAAREKIVDLLKRPELTKYRNWILLSLNIPTYRPVEGNIYL
ncbi:MAG: class I SAM-dependent methyltransferase [bacterium]